ncbi:MAG: hypothetical protein VX380_03070, partial [Verrucomicrobiota bacterium]
FPSSKIFSGVSLEQAKHQKKIIGIAHTLTIFAYLIAHLHGSSTRIRFGKTFLTVTLWLA